MSKNINVGKICGSALCGLCERICVRADKVTDGCKCFFSGVREDNLGVTFAQGTTPAAPFSFVSADGSGDISPRNMTVAPAENGRLRIRYEAIIPATIAFTDASGATFYAFTQVSQPVSVVLKAPPDNRPYSVAVTGRLVGRSGSISAESASFSCCIALITALTVKCDVVIPSYGECAYPQCRSGEEEACAELFDSPPFV